MIPYSPVAKFNEVLRRYKVTDWWCLLVDRCTLIRYFPNKMKTYWAIFSVGILLPLANSANPLSEVLDFAFGRNAVASADESRKLQDNTYPIYPILLHEAGNVPQPFASTPCCYFTEENGFRNLHHCDDTCSFDTQITDEPTLTTIGPDAFASFSGGVLHLINTGLREISPNAFQDSPQSFDKFAIVMAPGLIELDAKAFDGFEGRKLLINSNGIERVTNAFSYMPQLEELYLADNHINAIQGDVFRNLPGIQYINLSGNNLDFISKDLFIGLPVLQHIILVANPGYSGRICPNPDHLFAKVAVNTYFCVNDLDLPIHHENDGSSSHDVVYPIYPAYPMYPTYPHWTELVPQDQECVECGDMGHCTLFLVDKCAQLPQGAPSGIYRQAATGEMVYCDQESDSFGGWELMSDATGHYRCDFTKPVE